ncbi:MAG: hypothetical protein BMS9Abin07_0050 [Acidimicrobiia bacterium]|nr:MAG: hypothetical protein BMS9Abin07_0050 [Acidimicrobiia bacterium]
MSGGTGPPGGLRGEADLATDTLRDELLSLPGVESAVVEGDAMTPQGVRVRLATGVDAAVVGEEVQRVLAAHGLRSEMASSSRVRRGPMEVEVSPRGSTPTRAPRPRVEVQEKLAKVSVVEDRRGVMVRAETSTGRIADRAARSSGTRLDDAVVAAVSELAGVSPAPIVLCIDERDVEGTPVMTIVVEDGRERFAGSSVVEGGRPFALGLATWMAFENG